MKEIFDTHDAEYPAVVRAASIIAARTKASELAEALVEELAPVYAGLEHLSVLEQRYKEATERYPGPNPGTMSYASYEAFCLVRQQKNRILNLKVAVMDKIIAANARSALEALLKEVRL